MLPPHLPPPFDLAALTELSMSVPDRIAGMQAEVAAWRRDIHAHPEILFDVHRTAGSVAEKLNSSRTVLFHAGGMNETFSAACQTMPKPIFTEFWSALGNQKQFQYALATVA